MRAVIELFLQALREEEFYCKEADEWQFRDASACSICTSSAVLVARRFGGVVLGYHSVDNPTAFIGAPVYSGHDFALLNERWLIDYWAWHVAGLTPNPILDLSNESDRSTALIQYGPAGVWQKV